MYYNRSMCQGLSVWTARSDILRPMAECLPPRPSLLFRTPLYVRVLVALVIGSLWGAMAYVKPTWLNANVIEPMGQLGLLPVTLLRALAIPLIFFAILDGF